MSNHHHLDYLDLAKGFGICLVVLGHSRFPLHFAIDVFHMPLFFVLAGMTFTQPAVQSFSLFLIKKIDRILVPWVFFSILSAVVAYVIHWNKPTSFNAPLWFLQTYFCSIVIYTLLKIYCNRFISIILISLIFIFSYTDFLQALPFSLWRALISVVYIHIGTFIPTLLSKVNWPLVVAFIFFALYAIGVVLSFTFYNVEGLTYISGKVIEYNLILFWFTSISGCMALILFCYYKNKLVFFNWCGKNSLVIMLTHFPLCEYLNVLSSQILSKYNLQSVTWQSIIALFCYSAILLFCYSAILLFCYVRNIFLV